jgi:hypothetical protein
MAARTPLRLIIGGGGVVLIGSLFMPWAGGRSGWEFLTATDVFFLIVGIVAVAAATTGGEIGLFRPDVSLNGMADLFSLVASALIAWLLIFEFPAAASRGVGVFVALGASVAIASAAGDYRVLHGASWFPRLERGRSADRE